VKSVLHFNIEQLSCKQMTIHHQWYP